MVEPIVGDDQRRAQKCLLKMFGVRSEVAGGRPPRSEHPRFGP